MLLSVSLLAFSSKWKRKQLFGLLDTIAKREMLLFHEQLLKWYIYEKYVHDMSHVDVCPTIANMQKICKNSMNLQVLCLIHVCSASRNWHQISCPSYFSNLYSFFASSITGEKNTNIYLYQFFYNYSSNQEKHEQIILILALLFYFIILFCFCHLILLSHLPTSI